MIKKEIFRQYDIRGKFPEEINTKNIVRLVRPYINTFKPESVVIGHDPLQGSSELYFPLCNEFSKNGVKVYRLGEVSTPMLYFASSFYDIPQGIILTASHLGVGYSGMKIVLNGMPPTSEQMMQFASDPSLDDADGHFEEDTVSFEVLDNIYSDYINKILELVEIKGDAKRYKFAVDVSNGPNAHVARRIFDILGLNYVILNEDVRTHELAHDTNPKIAKNRLQLVETVIAHEADFGVMWDGDGDRAYFVDWKGDIIPPEFVGVNIGANLINQKKGSKVTLDVRGSAAFEHELAKIGGNVIRIQAWHVPIKFEMEKDADVVFGMETSGHYVFRDLYRIDDGLLASLMFIAALTNEPEPLRQLLTKFRAVYRIIEEINFETPKSEEALVEEFKAEFPDAKVSLIDGFTAEYDLWRFNIRSSKTEPIIRLNISGTDFDLVDKMLERIKGIIGGKVLE